MSDVRHDCFNQCPSVSQRLTSGLDGGEESKVPHVSLLFARGGNGGLITRKKALLDN